VSPFKMYEVCVLDAVRTDARAMPSRRNHLDQTRIT